MLAGIPAGNIPLVFPVGVFPVGMRVVSVGAAVFTEVPCPFHGPRLVGADAGQVTVIPFGTAPVPVIFPVVPGDVEMVPDTPGVMIVVVEVVTEPDIAVVIREVDRT